ncbi:hypothetical protein QBC38DRAFT_505509, partial [Podospora fimiseda]
MQAILVAVKQQIASQQRNHNAQRNAQNEEHQQRDRATTGNNKREELYQKFGLGDRRGAIQENLRGSQIILSPRIRSKPRYHNRRNSSEPEENCSRS